jgi:hypothetical protein
LAAVKKLLDNLASSPVFQSINVGLFAASTAMASGYEDPNMARMAFRAQSEAESEALGAEGAAMRSGPVPSDHVVVRGGESPVPPAGETFSGAAGKDLLEAAAAIPHGKLRQTTAGDITAGGGTVEWKPERTRSGVMNYNHVNVCLGTGACPFGPVQPNPVPKNQRIQ